MEVPPFKTEMGTMAYAHAGHMCMIIITFFSQTVMYTQKCLDLVLPDIPSLWIKAIYLIFKSKEIGEI